MTKAEARHLTLESPIISKELEDAYLKIKVAAVNGNYYVSLILSEFTMCVLKSNDFACTRTRAKGDKWEFLVEWK